MRNQTKYLFVYLFVLCLLVGSVVQLAQAQDEVSSEPPEVVALDQAQLDQMLAPIALYPDTLLSHILVASTYPLEVIQAARWRAANEDLDEQQALNAVEDKDWDPSVQALVPFNDLLQKLSEDLGWLQSLGSGFLVNEQQILASVQNLRQKAYEQGNLTNNDYVNVEQDEGEIVIETVRREVLFVPYYDTRVVFGNWWWQNHQPYYWHRPIHSVFSAGLYWSSGFNIRPSFYFGGFHWRNRHVVANYHFRRNTNRHWSSGHNRRQVMRVKEYPRWSHNQEHRRGTQYRVNGQRMVRNINTSQRNGNTSTGYQQFDKHRVLNVNRDAQNSKDNARKYSNAERFKKALGNQQKTARHTKTLKANKQVNNKQRIINHSKNQQNKRLSNNNQPSEIARITKKKTVTKQKNNGKPQKHASLGTQNNNERRSAVKAQNKRNSYTTNNKSSHKSNGHHVSSHQRSRSRPSKVAHHNRDQVQKR